MTVLLVILFSLCLVGIVCYPGTSEEENGIERVAVGAALLVCVEAVAGKLFYWIHIPVNCVSIGSILALCALCFWYGIWRNRRLQKLLWRRSDIIGILLLVVFVCFVSVNLFGKEQNLQYPNQWAAENFARAMAVVHGQVAENVNLATIIEALFIQMFTNPSSPSMNYRGYMLATLFLLLAEVCLFYAVVISLSRRKTVSMLAPIFVIGYFWGYPAYNYMFGNDDVFGIRSICVLLMVYVLGRIPWRLAENRKKILLYGALLIGFTVDIVVMMFRYSLSGVSNGREIYSSMYGDLVFFVPVAIYVCCNVFLKKKSEAICVISMAALGCVLILYNYWFNSVISNYDYYQNYALLWLLGWLLAVQAFDFSEENGELPQFFSYAGFVITLAVLVLSGFAGRVSMGMGDLLYVTKSFFSLYSNNKDYLVADYGEYRVADATLELYDDITLNYGEEDIPILTEEAAERIWYDALTDNHSAVYGMTQCELPELLKLLEQDHIKMITVQKDKEGYREYQEYFDGCEVVSETETAVLYTMPLNGWTDVSGMNVSKYEEKLELYSCVVDNLAEEQVPLMAAKESYLDYLLYENITGNDSSNFYTWHYSARDGILNLNNQGVKYVVLLKDDEYCIGSSMYFDTQETVYENEAGKIVRCVGEQWNLGE